MNHRETFKHKKRIVVKIGSSSLTHKETGNINYSKLDHLTRVLSDIHSKGIDVVLVSSGAIAVGRKAMNLAPRTIGEKQALAAIGQAKLMRVYEKMFATYNQVAAQILLTKNTLLNGLNKSLAFNTFDELFKLGAIPIVNENDTISTYEIENTFGDNDRLSAIVSSLIHADLLILLSDIDGLYSDDPHTNPDAKFISVVEKVTPELFGMGKNTSSSAIGTGGMKAKLEAAQIATNSGADMVICNSDNVDIIFDIIEGKEVGTVLLKQESEDFDLVSCLMD